MYRTYSWGCYYKWIDRSESSKQTKKASFFATKKKWFQNVRGNPSRVFLGFSKLHHPDSDPGSPGCKNIRAGGDTATPPTMTSHRWYATYVVYRSFKYPPPIPKLEKFSNSFVNAH